MAITFAQQGRKQQYLLLALVVIVLLSLGVVWMGFFAPSKAVPSAPLTEPIKPPKLEIDFKVLEMPDLQEMKEFPAIQPLEESVQAGRGNPFIPYGDIENENSEPEAGE